jgi:hypothetical protein
MGNTISRETAKYLIEKWVSQKIENGHFELPEHDVVIYSEMQGNELIRYTFKYCLKIYTQTIY